MCLACRANKVIVSDGAQHDIAEQVREVTGVKGAYAAVDCVGGKLTGKLLAGVREGGTLLVYGMLSGTDFSAGISDVMFQL